MGIEQLDYLYAQSQTMLGYLDSMNDVIVSAESNLTAIAESLNTPASEIDNFNLDLETLIGTQDQLEAYINAGETGNAIGLIGNVKVSILAVKTKLQTTKSSIDAAKTTFESIDLSASKTMISTATALINELIPMITAEKEKVIGDGKTWHNYKCKVCSIKCPLRLRGKPSKSVLKTCLIFGTDNADFKEGAIESGTDV
jgi:soluble cytochrome b562